MTWVPSQEKTWGLLSYRVASLLEKKVDNIFIEMIIIWKPNLYFVMLYVNKNEMNNPLYIYV